MSKSAAQRRGHIEPSGVPATQRRQGFVGRPSLYSAQMVADAVFAARQGATDVEIAEGMGISIASFYLWCNQHPEFSEAVEAAKEQIDNRVERSMLSKAVGFKVRTQKLHQGQVIEIDEYFAPDHSAQMNWLANRRRNKWRKQVEANLVLPETPGQDQINEPTDRQLALAVLAMLAEAEAHADTPTLELRPNEEHNRDPEDQADEASAEAADGGRGQPARNEARPRRSRRASYDERDFDPDFDE